MKIKSYRILFSFFSFLSDKTNGAPLFVKYKLLLGTLLIGLTGISCNRQKEVVTCYDMNFVPDTSSVVKPSIPDEPKSFIMCYEVAAPIDTIEETVTKPENK